MKLSSRDIILFLLIAIAGIGSGGIGRIALGAEPRIEITREDTLYFGSVPQGLSQMDALVLQNRSGEYQVVTVRILTGPDSSYYLANPDDSLIVLLPGAKQLILIGFAPRMQDTIVGLLSIVGATAAATVYQTVTLLGVGIQRSPSLEQLGYPNVVYVTETMVGDTVATHFTIVNRLQLARSLTVRSSPSQGPFTIEKKKVALPPLGTEKVTIWFHPDSVGYAKSYAYLQVDQDTAMGRVLILGYARHRMDTSMPNVVFPPLIDFGGVPLTQWVDTTIRIVNREDTVVVIRALYTTHPAFRILEPITDTLRLLPSDTGRITIRFVPQKEGVIEGTLYLPIGRSMQLPIRLIGKGIQLPPVLIIAMDSVRAAVGDTVVLAVWMVTDSTMRRFLRFSGAQTLQLALQWDATVLWLVDSVSYRYRSGYTDYVVAHFQLPVDQLSGVDTIAVLRFVVCLGDRPTTVVGIDSAVIQTATGISILQVSHLQSGWVGVRNVWHYGSVPRLLNPEPIPFRFEVYPNPLRNAAVATVDGIATRGDSLMITIYQTEGSILKRWAVSVDHQPLQIPLPRTLFPVRGLYFVVCQYRNSAVTRLLIVR